MSHPISEWTKKELKNEVAALRAELANAKAEVETAKRIARENYDACNAYMGISTKVRGDNDKLRQQLGEERQKVVDAAETISAMQIEAATLRHPPAPGASAAVLAALRNLVNNNGGPLQSEEAAQTTREDDYIMVRLADFEAAVAALDAVPASGEPGDGELLPKEPPPGLLMSMAIRYDHALGCPGYYDQQQLFGEKGPSHSQRLESTLTTMRQLYEEVSGHGFYRKSRESEYAAITAHQPPTAKREGEP